MTVSPPPIAIHHRFRFTGGSTTRAAAVNGGPDLNPKGGISAYEI
jgi:hypothetical protein